LKFRTTPLRRADRLLQIVQVLRRQHAPITAQGIADAVEASIRTIYRDIATLQASGAPIDGETGIGYILRPGYDLPPLMFTRAELETIVLGMYLVRDRADEDLGRAAEDVLAKISAVLPDDLTLNLVRSTVAVYERQSDATLFGSFIPAIRRAVQERRKLQVSYLDGDGIETRRTIWPLGFVYFTHVTLVPSWCELRNAFRVFRSDRFKSLQGTAHHFDSRNGALFKEAAQGILAHKPVQIPDNP
jgi:predicted DNA-binding transcriptional regulator YafY